MDVEDSLSEVRMSFFILHGEADTVTDPEVSRALYERAASTDKTIKLYPGMWHGLTAGEPDENVELVFSDIVAWLDQRSRHWKPEERVRAPPEPEQQHHHQAQAASKNIARVGSRGGDSGVESPVSEPGRPQRRSSFLCGLGGRPNQQQSRM
uniref:Serine aminopeptidase S33 domain-containing protein n=1 Tax=Arundo donax TaxID=35708 RepID=A0A0A9D1R6_ARUDO